MSTRTIIEINHDYLHELSSDPTNFAALVAMLRSEIGMRIEPPGDCGLPGVRILGQRHHSETLKLEVK